MNSKGLSIHTHNCIDNLYYFSLHASSETFLLIHVIAFIAYNYDIVVCGLYGLKT